MSESESEKKPETPPPTDESLIEVPCPSCKAILTISRVTGEVLSHKKLTSEEEQKRRIEGAIDRAKRSSQLAEEKFVKAKEREKGKMDRLSKLFDETMKKKIEEGDTGKPASPWDLD